MVKKKKQIIGCREQIDFPDIKLYGITAKVDTGAYIMALHCHDIRVEKRNGKNTLCFKLLHPSHPEYNEQENYFTDFEEREIKNSFGVQEKRFVIKSSVVIAGRRIKSLISLTDRRNMRYPVLIGRRLLKGRFIVDVSKENLWNSRS